MPVGKPRSEEEGAGWLTTFGDMITLLFTFFVLVYSFCSYDQGEWETANRSIKGALSVIPGDMGNRVLPGGGAGPFSGHMAMVRLIGELDGAEEAEKRAFGEELARIRKGMGGIEGVDLEETATGFVFRVANPVLFHRGRAEARTGAHDFLKAIGRATHKARATVIVTGHTCDLPISTTEYESNWELSAHRATNVLRMIESVASPETRFIAVARGEYSPLVPNDSEAHRARNRRVEIRIDLQGGLPFEL
jgi:chemotaxis protein MotB